MNLIEHLDFYQHVQPNKLFIFDEKHFFSSKEAYDVVSSLACQYDTFGLKENDKVLLVAERSVDGIFLFLALEMIGCRTFFVGPEKNECFAHDTSIQYQIEGDDGLFFLSDFSDHRRILLSFKRTNAIFNKYRDDYDYDFVVGHSKDDKKAIMVSENSLLKSAEESEKRLGLKKNDVHLMTLPFHHMEGICQVVYTIVLQQSLFVPQSNDAESILSDISLYHVSVLLGNLDFYHQLMMEQLQMRKNLSSLHVGLVSLGQENKEELIRIEKSLSVSLIPVFGKDECIPITMKKCSLSKRKRLEGVGKPFDKMGVLISDDGEICVRSPFVSHQYLDGTRILTEDGYFHTGEQGFFDKRGNLHIIRK